MPQLNGGLVKATIKVKAWKSNYIPLFNIDVIIYPFLNPDAGLANLCW